MATVRVIRANARSLPLPDASVDLIVTSPPYFGLRSYTDRGEHYDGQIGSEETPAEYITALLRCTREWMRVLKPSGSIFVNLGDKYAGGGMGGHGGGRLNGYVGEGVARRVQAGVRDKSLRGLPWRYALGCIDQLGLILRAEIVWDKPNGLPESVTDRVRRSHEQVFHFVKQPRYYSAVDEIREPHDSPKDMNRARAGRAYLIRQNNGGGNAGNTGVSNPLGKLPGSVWEIPSAPLVVPAHLGIDHFAAYPPELCRRIILGWSPSGGVVVDPFGGTGTTALVASVFGRIGYSFDMSADYCRLARWRTADPGQRARALGVAKPPPVPDGQDSLFDLAGAG